jgi:hypothetical protein
VKRETDVLGLALLAALVRVHTADPVLLVCHDGVALPIRWVGHGPGRVRQDIHQGQARRSCPTGRCRDYAREGRTDQSIGNPAGRQSGNGSRPSRTDTTMYVGETV